MPLNMVFSLLQFSESAVQLRTKQMYNSHCEGLGGPLHKHIATTYGIVRDSALNACHFFHVTSGMVPDIMHDILEGTLELCMRHLLIHLIHEEKLFSIGILNSRIASFNYGPSEVRNKPTQIATTCLASDGHLKQSGTFYVLTIKVFCTVQVLECSIIEVLLAIYSQPDVVFRAVPTSSYWTPCP